MATLVVMALAWLCPTASYAQQESPVWFGNDNKIYSDSLTVSLITCYPGPEIYELCGHSALRVKGQGCDSVWNYGLFDFNQPNFIYRFVKGETDYMGAGYPFAHFMPGYLERGSKVVEQELNLTQTEARRLLAAMRKSALPQYRTYRYNYVKDNCATRISSMTDTTLLASVIYPDTVHYGTFRNEMRHYHKDYPWYQFGIDICLGLGIDHKITPEEEMFVPVEMMRMFGGARLSDGRRLVTRTTIINPGRDNAVLPPTPWYLTPLTFAFIVLIFAITVAVHDFRKLKVTKWAYSLWFSILGTAGLLVAFLVLFSEHEATSPNILILWLNPFQFLIGVCIWWKTVRPLASAMALYDTIAMICMFAFWPFQGQSANPAFFPLMGATLILASAYAVVQFKANKANSQTSSRPAPGVKHKQKRK